MVDGLDEQGIFVNMFVPARVVTDILCTILCINISLLFSISTIMNIRNMNEENINMKYQSSM